MSRSYLEEGVPKTVRDGCLALPKGGATPCPGKHRVTVSPSHTRGLCCPPSPGHFPGGAAGLEVQGTLSLTWAVEEMDHKKCRKPVPGQAWALFQEGEQRELDLQGHVPWMLSWREAPLTASDATPGQ